MNGVGTNGTSMTGANGVQGGAYRLSQTENRITDGFLPLNCPAGVAGVNVSTNGDMEDGTLDSDSGKEDGEGDPDGEGDADADMDVEMDAEGNKDDDDVEASI